ncbi:MAG TPA: hypothetical protein VEV41_24235 [Terriglobales bacterium]|jgi:hypothetical protein|nr:hypothetical protein [Terriglobales bacterium]
MNACTPRSKRPGAYWDRAGNVVRDWNTDQPLPGYEGMCLVYLDIRGPVFVTTFLQNGERCWEGLD